jgi:Flp pilus assembly protein TadD
LGDIALRASNLQEALTHYQRAVELQPNDAEACLGLGRVLTQMNRTAEAEQYLKRSAQLEPFTAATHYRLAMVYRATGRPAEAQKELAEFERLKDMKERLKQVYQDMRLQPVKPERDSVQERRDQEM